MAYLTTPPPQAIIHGGILCMCCDLKGEWYACSTYHSHYPLTGAMYFASTNHHLITLRARAVNGSCDRASWSSLARSTKLARLEAGSYVCSIISGKIDL